MQVTLDRIEESYSLSTGSVESYLVFILPSGERLRAAVDETTARAVLEARRTQISAPPSEQTEIMGWNPPQVPGATDAEEPLVSWEHLPESALSNAAKSILRSANVDKTLKQSELLNLREQIMEKLDAQQVGKVHWNSGSRSTTSAVPHRTVPMDEKGNPLPPGGIVEVDSGEVIDDEDGIQSL